MNPEEIPLRDLHLPEPVGWWPLAPGWWILLALAAMLLGWQAWLAIRRWQRARPRRIALRRLRELAGQPALRNDVARLASELSILVRRAMLAYVPRQQAAGLTGDAWLRWLDRGLPQPVFAEGPARELDTLPYRNPQTLDEVDVDALIEAVRLRLATPLPEETA